MQTFTLEVNPRSEKARALRGKNMIPAVYYGRQKKNLSLACDYQTFRRVFEKAGENTIIELQFGKEKLPVLVHDIQYDPITDRISHIDFIHVDMEKEIVANVSLNFAGIAPAVKDLGGILTIQKHEVKIKCLPKDLIHNIDVDISGIVDFHVVIRVKDLKVPAEIKLLDDPELTIVTAIAPKEEKEEVAPVTPEAAAAAAGVSTPTAEAVPGAPAAAPEKKSEGKTK